MRKIAYLMVLLILATPLLSACQASDNPAALVRELTTVQGDYQLSTDSRGRLNDYSYVQAIAEAINDGRLLTDIYKSLRRAGMRDLSEADFAVYVKALQPAETAEIQHFGRVSAEDEAKYAEQVAAYVPDLRELALHSHYYSLAFKVPNRSSSETVILAIQEKDGRAYLDSSWIRHSTRIFDFSGLYFQAIDQRDKAALAWLLSRSEDKFSPTDKGRLAMKKAERLLRFYADNRISAKRNSLQTLLLPGMVEFSQQYNLGDYNTKTRFVRFFDQGGKIRVREDLKERLTESEAQIQIYGEPLFKSKLSSWQPLVTLGSFNELLGPIQSVEDLPSEREPGVNGNNGGNGNNGNNGNTGDSSKATDGNADTGKANGQGGQNGDSGKSSKANDANRRYRIRFYGCEMILKGTVNKDHTNFHGAIEQMRFTSRIFSFGSQLRVGMPVIDFYLKFPFAAESGYQIDGKIAGVESRLTIQSMDERVQTMIWLLQR